MIKVFYISPELSKKQEVPIPSSRDRTVVKFKSIESLLHSREERPDVIVIQKDESAGKHFKEFAALYREVPKIVFSEEEGFRGFASWMKHPLTYAVDRPSPGVLNLLLKKALREKETMEENLALKGKVGALTKELEFFDGISKTLTSSLELNDILTTIMKKAKKLIKAESWSVLLLDEESGELFFEKITGKKRDKKKIKNFRLKMGEGIAGWVAQEGMPLVVPDVSVDNRFYPQVDRETAFKTKSLMCIPIKSKGSTLGVLEIVNKTTNEPFTKDDLALMMRMVDHAAIAIERASLYQKMAELSVTDDLTKLFNTRYLNRTLELEITRSTRHNSSLSLIFMDVDHFKTINDNYGHLVGSKLLVEMGQLLLKSLRTIDIVARYGGDEFVIVLPQTPPSSAIQIAERIRKSIEKNTFLKKDGYSLNLTASFGVAAYPDSAKSKEELLRLADEAMYRVKDQTRNGVYAIV